MSAISRIASMLGWSEPRRIGRPGVVTSTASAARRAVSSDPRSPAPRSARAASIAPRTAFATAPTLGRSSAGRRADPAQDAGQPALLAEDVELQRVERRHVRRRPRPTPSASAWSASRSRVRSARSTLLLVVARADESANPRSSWTSRARGRDRGPVDRAVRRSSPARRSARRSTRRGWRGRPGSCDRSGRPPSSGRR